MNMIEAPMDRISNLPDPLLHHIHSFLEIKDGARTSVLSKRWNHIWTTVPTLHFRNRKEASPSKTYQFMDFVDGTLHRHNSSSIDTFSLHWNCWRLRENSVLVKNRAHSWISTVIRGNIKDLSLKLFAHHYSWFIPLSLFTSESLTSLELQTHPSIIHLPKHISFPRLKRLILTRFEISDESWNAELFSNSPVLEELTLDECQIKTDYFCISIPTLKILGIYNSSDRVTEVRNCVLKINAPRLVRIGYSDYVAKEFVLSSFLALTEADVRFKTAFSNQYNGNAPVIRFLRALAHVRWLTVNHLTLQAICSAYDRLRNLQTFHNIKMLIVSGRVLITDEGLNALFKAAPYLESLVFDEILSDDEEDSDEENEGDGSDDNEDNDVDSVERENSHYDEDEVDVSDAAECNNDANSENSLDDEDEVDVSDAYKCNNNADSVGCEHSHDDEDEVDMSAAAERNNNDECESYYDSEDDSSPPDIVTNECLFPHLKSVRFQEFSGNPRELMWVKLILKNAKALQLITIRHYPGLSCENVKSEKELMAEIPSLPRASAGCVFKFLSRDWKLVALH